MIAPFNPEDLKDFPIEHREFIKAELPKAIDCTEAEIEKVIEWRMTHEFMGMKDVSGYVSLIERWRREEAEKDFIFKWLFTFKTTSYKISKLYDNDMKTLDNDLTIGADHIAFKGTNEYSNRIFDLLLSQGINIRDTHKLERC